MYCVPKYSLVDPKNFGGDSQKALLTHPASSLLRCRRKRSFWQTVRQRVNMLVFENDGFRPAPSYGAEFQQRLIVACRVETDRHVLSPVGVDEKQASQHHWLVIEGCTARPVDADVGRVVGQQLLNAALPLSSRLSTSSHRSSSRIVWDVIDRGFYRAATNSTE